MIVSKLLRKSSINIIKPFIRKWFPARRAKSTFTGHFDLFAMSAIGTMKCKKSKFSSSTFKHLVDTIENSRSDKEFVYKSKFESKTIEDEFDREL